MDRAWDQATTLAFGIAMLRIQTGGTGWSTSQMVH